MKNESINLIIHVTNSFSDVVLETFKIQVLNILDLRNADIQKVEKLKEQPVLEFSQLCLYKQTEFTILILRNGYLQLIAKQTARLLPYDVK